MPRAEIPLSSENSELSVLMGQLVICLCSQGCMARGELMKLSTYRHAQTVTDGSGEEGRCRHMAHWAG